MSARERERWREREGGESRGLQDLEVREEEVVGYHSPNMGIVYSLV